MSDDLYARARKIFGSMDGRICWPYNLGIPPKRAFRNDPTPERYEGLVRRAQKAQLIIVEWAEQYGFKESGSGCCPWWLRGNVSRRCNLSSDACTRYGSGSTIPDHYWLDHPIFWLKDGRPAAITSAPYQVSAGDEDRIRWWLSEDSRLRVAYGTGWYGFGTRQILMWRTDRIDVVAPAEWSRT